MYNFRVITQDKLIHVKLTFFILTGQIHRCSCPYVLGTVVKNIRFQRIN